MRPVLLVAILVVMAPAPAAAQWAPWLADSLAALAAAESPRELGLAVVDVTTGRRLAVGGGTRLHAASTMKVPVLVTLARRIDAGRAGWDDSITVTGTFRSIVDGSAYALDPADDSDSTVYALIGRKATLRHLAERMIVRSSNLATNVLIDLLGPRAVQATLDSLGAGAIEVHRGVEDGKAFRAGLNNTVTADGLGTLFLAIARGTAASAGQNTEMLRILRGQQFRDGLPAGLPPGVAVAHKTGEITAIAHDAGIVDPDGPAPVVVVALTRGYADRSDAARTIARFAALVWAARAR